MSLFFPSACLPSRPSLLPFFFSLSLFLSLSEDELRLALAEAGMNADATAVSRHPYYVARATFSCAASVFGQRDQSSSSASLSSTLSPPPPYALSTLSFSRPGDRRQVRRVMAEADKNHDGKISFPEYKRAMLHGHSERTLSAAGIRPEDVRATDSLVLSQVRACAPACAWNGRGTPHLVRLLPSIRISLIPISWSMSRRQVLEMGDSEGEEEESPGKASHSPPWLPQRCNTRGCLAHPKKRPPPPAPLIDLFSHFPPSRPP